MATNENPNSPYSYQARGRWITTTPTGVEVPDGTDADKVAVIIRRELDGVRLVLGPKAFEAKKVTFNVTHASAGVVSAIEALGGKVDMPKAEETKADA